MKTKTESDRRGHEGALETFEYFLKPGYILANRDDTVIRTVLGNAVTVTVYDKKQHFGGINHFVIPATNNRRRSTPQFGNVSVTALCRMMLDMGGNPRNLEAQIMGGGFNAKLGDENLGSCNVEIARRMLNKFRIPIISEDIGGTLGRKVIYHSGTNETIIYKVKKIRDSDWFSIGDDINLSR